jgi:hypothetical protein
MRKKYTGNFRKTKAGNYELSISLGKNVEGNRIRRSKTVYVNTDEEAAQALHLWLKEIYADEARWEKQSKIRFFIDKALDYLEKEGEKT